MTAEERRKYNREWYKRHRQKEVCGDFSEHYAMTHAEIAKRLGLTRARVWQIERRALAKLRQALAAVGVANVVDATPTAVRETVYPEWE